MLNQLCLMWVDVRGHTDQLVCKEKLRIQGASEP